MLLLSSLIAVFVNAPELPTSQCVPVESSMVFPVTRVEALDSKEAALQTGRSVAELDKALEKHGAVIGFGVLVVPVQGQKGRYEAVELERPTPVHLTSYAGEAHPLAVSGERKTTGEVLSSPDGLVVNVSEQVVSGDKVVAHETRSHWISRRDGELKVMAALRCGIGSDGTAPAPRWSIGRERVEVKGCGQDISFPRTLVEGCALGQGVVLRRVSDYIDLANETEFFDNPMHQARILRLALAATGATTAEKARPFVGLWWHYGRALRDALRKGLEVHPWEATTALQNAVTSESTDFAKGYAAMLLGDTHQILADQAKTTADKKAALERAIKAYETSLKLNKDENTAERLAEAKRKLKELR